MEELELDDVRLLEGQIQSASLKRLSIIKCYIDDGFLVDAPNLVSLCFIRPLGIERKGGANSSSDRLWWPVWLNDDDGYDHDDDFFANASAVQSDDKRGSKSDQDDLEGCNDDDRTVAYDEIADEYSSNGGPGDEHGGYSESDDSTICGPYGLFNVLVKTSLIMIAREGEVVFNHPATFDHVILHIMFSLICMLSFSKMYALLLHNSLQANMSLYEKGTSYRCINRTVLNLMCRRKFGQFCLLRDFSN